MFKPVSRLKSNKCSWKKTLTGIGQGEAMLSGVLRNVLRENSAVRVGKSHFELMSSEVTGRQQSNKMGKGSGNAFLNAISINLIS